MFWASPEALTVTSPIHCKYPVQMIHLVLEKFGECSFRLQPLRRSVFVHVPESTANGSLQLHEQFGERKTIVPHYELLVTKALPLRVMEAVGFALKLDVNQSATLANLDSADAPSETVSALEVMQCIPQILEYGPYQTYVGYWT